MVTGCVVCAEQNELQSIEVAGREVLLCQDHGIEVAGRDSFVDMRSLFCALRSDRRRNSDRRRRDRRAFPRPEMRRQAAGRRASDPQF